MVFYVFLMDSVGFTGFRGLFYVFFVGFFDFYLGLPRFIWFPWVLNVT